MKEYQPPKPIKEIINENTGLISGFTEKPMIFLAGSIEMGAAEEWQKEVIKELEGIPEGIVLNPRRDNWDASWEQAIENDNFRTQVQWELTALDKCDYILMYLSPNTTSPISLLELGLYAESGKLIVCCPDGFERKGNVEIVCGTYNIPLYDNLKKAIAGIKMKLF